MELIPVSTFAFWMGPPVSLVQLGKKSKYTLACSVLRNVAAQVYTYFFITLLIKVSHPKGRYALSIKLT